MKMLLVLYTIMTAFVRSGQTVTQKLVQTIWTQEGSFCATVVREEPVNLTPREQIQWHSKPAISLDLYVQANVLVVFTAIASTYRLNSSDLTTGQHDIQYRHSYGAGDVHSLDLYLDGATLEPQPQKTSYRHTDAHFMYIKVFAKGPLILEWNSTCQDTSTSTLTESSTAESNQDLTSTDLPLEETFKTTTIFAPLTNTPSISETKGQSKHWYVIVAIVVGSIVSMAIIASVCLFFRRRSLLRQKKLLRRNTDAEKEKQKMIQDAKRLSYMEQLRWVESNVDK